MKLTEDLTAYMLMRLDMSQEDEDLTFAYLLPLTNDTINLIENRMKTISKVANEKDFVNVIFRDSIGTLLSWEEHTDPFNYEFYEYAFAFLSGSPKEISEFIQEFKSDAPVKEAVCYGKETFSVRLAMEYYSSTLYLDTPPIETSGLIEDCRSMLSL